MREQKPFLDVACHFCGGKIQNTSHKRKSLAKGLRVHCSMRCSRETASAHLRSMAESSRLRMLTANPMRIKENRDRVSKTLKRIGHAPRIRGGNGRGLTIHEQRLLLALGDGWVGNFIFPTRHPKGRGIPTHYKLDLAFPEAKIAVEVDGYSHCAIRVREKDEKKTRFLTMCGWSVFRCANTEVENELESITSTLKEMQTTLLAVL